MKLSKKSKQLKKVLSETELLKFKFEQLSAENSNLNAEKLKLNRKIEEICFRFLDLIDRRSDEVGEFKENFKVEQSFTTRTFQRANIKAQLDVLQQELERLESICLRL